MTEGQAKKLCLALLHAETEDEVGSILESHGYLNDDRTVWRTFGDIENNRGTIHNQQSDAGAAIVEKIINSVDAVLVAKCWQEGTDPESPQAPQNMMEAAERFFGVRNGRLDSLDSGSRTKLANYIHFVATGSKHSPNYVIVDLGEGQTPQNMPLTFLSLHRTNKYGIPFTQGINNCGGTGVLPNCGEHGYQLIISKRHADIPTNGNDPTRGLWGFTLVRRLRPEKGKRRISMYVYLAPGGEILSFAADELPVLPSQVRGREQPAPYAEGLKYGSCVKLYSYRWSGTAKSIATTNARAELEKWLYTLCLPVRITETRDYKAHFFQTTLSGLSANFADQGGGEEDARLEAGFDPASAIISPKDIGRLPVTIAVSKARDAKGKPVRKTRIPHGVVLTINGQVHTHLRPDFASSKLKYSAIAPYLHVAVDCSEMPPEISEELFLTSRDRHRSREVYDAIEQELVAVLREHQGLRDLNARRRQDALKDVLNDDEPVRVLQALVKADPSLAALLGKGNRIHNPLVPDDHVEIYHGQKLPTFFRIRKEPKNGLVKDCPLNKTCRVEFETDASNDYFVRGESPGRRTVTPDGMCVRESLFNGKYLSHFSLPSGCNVGDEFPITVSVTDDSRSEPLTGSLTIRAVKAAVNGTTSSSGKRRPKGGGQLGVPLPIMVTKDGRPLDGKATQRWEEHAFDDHSAVKIDDQGEQGVDIYINMDNRHLMGEMSREPKASERPVIMYWFKYGMLLAALGMLQELRRVESKAEKQSTRNGREAGDNGNGEDAEDSSPRLTSIHHALSGLASVIVPVIRRLAEGPRTQ